jgi:hypothetical protein
MYFMGLDRYGCVYGLWKDTVHTHNLS